MGQLEVKNRGHRPGSRSDCLSSVSPHTPSLFTPSSLLPSPHKSGITPSKPGEMGCISLAAVQPSAPRSDLFCFHPGILGIAPPPLTAYLTQLHPHHEIYPFFLLSLSCVVVSPVVASTLSSLLRKRKTPLLKTICKSEHFFTPMIFFFFLFQPGLHIK